MKKAFTLIELLIVVAIIAILAAIAVPNFLEAQIRAKVSRVHNDMRSMATAIESYYVDYNKPPLGQVSMRGLKPVPADPDMSANRFWNIYAQSRITTPVAYISNVLLDPFIDVVTDSQGRREYVYHDYVWDGHKDGSDPWRCYHEFGYTWGMQSRGPSMQNVGGIQGLLTTALPNMPRIYDSTNGTKSYGSIVRSNKGIYKGPAGQ